MHCSTVLQLLNQEPLKVYNKPQLLMDWTTNLAKKRSAKQYVKQNQAKLHDRMAYPWSFKSCWISTHGQASFSLLTNLGNWEVATRRQRCPDNNHLPKERRAFRLQQLQRNLTAADCWKYFNKDHPEHNGETHCCFQSLRISNRLQSELRTTDCIFVARQLQEKCKEQICHLYAVFLNLTKAFDTVNREALGSSGKTRLSGIICKHYSCFPWRHVCKSIGRG